MSTPVFSPDAPAPIGAYVQGLIAQGPFLYCSGQIALNVQGELVGTDIESQTRQVFTNISHVLSAAGATLDDVVKTTVFLQDMNDFTAMNAVYGSSFVNAKPARSTVQVARLPKDALVEIEVIAAVRG